MGDLRLADEGPGLTFIGLGPGGPRGVSAAALSALRASGAAFADDYTAALPADTLAALEQTRSAPIVRLGRARLEAGDEIIHASRAPCGAVLLVVGDPMAATTHVSLRLRALREGLPVRLIFAPSIMHTAFSEAGLQHYKAGRIVSVPFRAKGFEPTSALAAIAANRQAGVHTLVLLDIKVEEGRLMTASEGIHELIEMARRDGSAAFPASTLVVAVARAGESDCLVRAGAASRVATLDLGPPMHCLIVPAALHFEEREALALIGLAREDELPPAK